MRLGYALGNLMASSDIARTKVRILSAYRNYIGCSVNLTLYLLSLCAEANEGSPWMVGVMAP